MNEGQDMRTDPFEEFYAVGEDIGSGQFAVVKKCTEKKSGEEFAVKFMKKKRSRACRRGVSAEQVAREVEVLRKIRHDGVIYLHEVFEAKQEYILVMELLSGGELFEFLAEREYITECEASQFTRQVVEALDFLHDHRIVHLDIKPENIVLKAKGESKIKLIDFGLAREIKLGETVKEIMGTPEFVAPEIINFESISLPTDMWSVGVLTYILLSGASPFLGEDNNDTFNNILNVDYEFDDEYFGGISKQAKDFVSSLLIKKPKDRMTAKDCLKNVWLEPERKRKATLIRTATFHAFTARARWKKSLQKVMAVNRIKLIGKKKEAKDTEGGVLLQKCYCSYHSDTESSSSDHEQQTESRSFVLLNLPLDDGKEKGDVVFQTLPNEISPKKLTDRHLDFKQTNKNDENETKNLTGIERKKMMNDSLRASHFLKG